MFVLAIKFFTNSKSNLESKTLSQAILDINQRLVAILQRIPDIRPIASFSSHSIAFRWKIIQRQVDQLQEMQLNILEDISRMELSLRQRHWPAASTLENISSIRRGCTPIHWRYIYLFILHTGANS
jgi:hypothetical protein